MALSRVLVAAEVVVLNARGPARSYRNEKRTERPADDADSEAGHLSFPILRFSRSRNQWAIWQRVM
jgi:hypothetical protein